MLPTKNNPVVEKVVLVNSEGNFVDPSPSLYERVLNSPDLIKTVNYADVGTEDERVISVVFKSVSLGIIFTDTHSYVGSAGAYRIAGTVRSQSNA